jgi:hypothetical protein
VDSLFSAIAVDVHFEDRGVMDEAIDGRQGHGLIREDFAPFAERLIGGDEHRSSLVAGADQLKQNAGLCLILGDIGEIVENQQVLFVEFGDRRFEREITARDLEFLHEICGSGEQYAPALFD